MPASAEVWGGLSFGEPGNKLKYNRKEEQRQEFSDGSGLEWTDYGARMYDQQIGRWHRTHNKAELYFATSPYVYALNQPTNAVDPDGNIVISFGEIILVRQVMNTGHPKITILQQAQQVKRHRDIILLMEEEQRWYMAKTGILIMKS